MEALALIVGIGIAAFLLMYFAQSLDKEHFLLKLLLLFFFFYMLILIPKAALDYNDNCDFVVTNSTLSTPITYYEYKYLCETNTNSTTTTFYKVLVWLQRLFITYFFVYVIYFVLRRFNKWKWLKG